MKYINRWRYPRPRVRFRCSAVSTPIHASWLRRNVWKLMASAAVVLVAVAMRLGESTAPDFIFVPVGAVAHRASATCNELNPSTGFTITIPASVQTNDVGYLGTLNGGGSGSGSVTDNDSGGNSWVQITAAVSGSTNLSVWWKRATSGTASKTITGSSFTTKCIAVVSWYSGAITTGDAHENAGGEVNASGNEAHAGTTPSADGSEVCLLVGNATNDLPVTSPSTTNPGALTIRAEDLTTAGTDAGINLSSAPQATANATGNRTWAQTDAASLSLVWDIKPEPPGAGQPTMRRWGGTGHMTPGPKQDHRGW